MELFLFFWRLLLLLSITKFTVWQILCGQLGTGKYLDGLELLYCCKNVNVFLCSDDNLIKSDDEDESDEDDYPSDEADESDDGMSYFEEEETKSRFTSYSMTSSVIRRNEG